VRGASARGRVVKPKTERGAVEAATKGGRGGGKGELLKIAGEASKKRWGGGELCSEKSLGRPQLETKKNIGKEAPGGGGGAKGTGKIAPLPKERRIRRGEKDHLRRVCFQRERGSKKAGRRMRKGPGKKVLPAIAKWGLHQKVRGRGEREEAWKKRKKKDKRARKKWEKRGRPPPPHWFSARPQGKENGGMMKKENWAKEDPGKGRGGKEKDILVATPRSLAKGSGTRWRKRHRKKKGKGDKRIVGWGEGGGGGCQAPARERDRFKEKGPGENRKHAHFGGNVGEEKSYSIAALLGGQDDSCPKREEGEGGGGGVGRKRGEKKEKEV